MHNAAWQNWRAEFKRLESFLEEIYGKFGPEDGLPETSLQEKRIPPPLKELYRFAGNRFRGNKEIILYNTIPMPWELTFSGDEVVFYIHDGYFYVWAAVGAEENPQVIKIDDDGKRMYEEERLCGFLYQICLYETCISLKYRIKYYTTCDKIHDVLTPWNKFPFKTRQVHDFFPNMFFYSEKTLGVLWRGKKVCTFYCGAKHSKHLAYMKPFIQHRGLKDDQIYTVDADIQAEKGCWEFFKEGSVCKEADFWQNTS